jgi:excisionase family DNA binding protein
MSELLKSNPASPWLTVEQASAYVQCGPKLLYREVRQGRLRAARVGGRRQLRFLTAWLDQWLEDQATPVETLPKRWGRAS